MKKEKEVLPPTEYALVKSINKNIFYYKFFLILWLALAGVGMYMKDYWSFIGSVVLFGAAVNFNLSQKIDKARLEVLRK